MKRWIIRTFYNLVTSFIIEKTRKLETEKNIPAEKSYIPNLELLFNQIRIRERI